MSGRTKRILENAKEQWKNDASKEVFKEIGRTRTRISKTVSTMVNSSLGSEIESVEPVTRQNLIINKIAAAENSEYLESATDEQKSGCHKQECTFESNTGKDDCSMNLKQATVVNEISNFHIEKCSIDNKLHEADSPMDRTTVQQIPESAIQKCSDKNSMVEAEASIDLNITTFNQTSECNTQTNSVGHDRVACQKRGSMEKKTCYGFQQCNCSHVSDTNNETFEESLLFSDYGRSFWDSPTLSIVSNIIYTIEENDESNVLTTNNNVNYDVPDCSSLLVENDISKQNSKTENDVITTSMEIINPITTLNSNNDLLSTNSISCNDIVNTEKGDEESDPYAFSEFDDIHSGSTEVLPIKHVEERNAYWSDQSELSFESHDDDRDKDYEHENDSQSESEDSLGSFTQIPKEEIRDLADNEVDCIIIEEVGNGNALDASTSTKTIIEPKDSNKKKVIQRKNTGQKKEVRCKFCGTDIVSTNFCRHLETNHQDEHEIKNIFQYPRKSKARRQALSLLRNHTNFNLYVDGLIRPYREVKENDGSQFYPCVYCRGVFKKEYLRRHAKICVVQKSIATKRPSTVYHVSSSQTEVACAMDPTNAISRLNVKEQVFNIMKGDHISFVAKQDLLIVYFGESYLKKHKRERKEYACSSRMRELSRLIIAYQDITDSKCYFKDILKPKNFDHFLAATRKITGYDPTNKIFKSPSLAMHLGTYLKDMCDELTHLVLKECPGFVCKSKEETESWLQEIKKFKKLVISRWNTEISSLANKDMQEKRWNKPLLVPLVSDIKIFREEAIRMAEECYSQIINLMDTIETYKLLVQSTLALLILFNRRRIGDVQYLKIEDYMRESKSNVKDFESVLTESEKILTTKYRRILNSGKGSRQVVILLPENLEKFINKLLECRKKYISHENEYVFALPQSKIKWGQGDVAIRYLTTKVKLQHPEAISSNKLRKHIATVAQILNLSKEDIGQFSKFMGHTEKTHAEFYELPVDIYQTAKVSKLLLMMEKGSLLTEFKGKSLSEIEFNENIEYPEENEKENALRSKKPKDNRFISDTASTSTDISRPSIPDYNPNDFADSDSETTITLSKKGKIKDTEIAKNDSDSDTVTIPFKKKKIQKRGWTADELNMITENFKTFIKSKNYPSQKNIMDFIEITSIKRTPQQIKAKLQHLMR